MWSGSLGRSYQIDFVAADFVKEGFSSLGEVVRKCQVLRFASFCCIESSTGVVMVFLESMRL